MHISNDQNLRWKRICRNNVLSRFNHDEQEWESINPYTSTASPAPGYFLRISIHRMSEISTDGGERWGISSLHRQLSFKFTGS